MTTTQPILECVPNFSEGRDEAKINAIADAIRSVEGAELLHVDTSPAANRTVMTFAGAPEAVTEAAFKAIKKAAEVIDMTEQLGVHPRIGATDVCPLVPLKGMTTEEVVRWSNVLGKRVGEEIGVPVYLYEHSTSAEHRRALPDIRKGQYEGFAEKMILPEWAPDYGPVVFSPQTGATVIGARDLLVAFNISLNTDDVTQANFIASRLRERGYMEKTSGGERLRTTGLLRKARAIGWYMEDYKQAQVSMNLLDYRVTSPLQAYQACVAVASQFGIEVVGAEVIGLIPESCLMEAGEFSFLHSGQATVGDKALLVAEGIRYLHLDALKPFHPQEKVLEYALQNAGIEL